MRIGGSAKGTTGLSSAAMNVAIEVAARIPVALRAFTRRSRRGASRRTPRACWGAGSRPAATPSDPRACRPYGNPGRKEERDQRHRLPPSENAVAPRLSDRRPGGAPALDADTTPLRRDGQDWRSVLYGEHMICPLPRASDLSAFTRRGGSPRVGLLGGANGVLGSRLGAGDEDPR